MSTAGDDGPPPPEDPDAPTADTRPLGSEVFDERYRVLRVLGEGGFGRVLLVADELHDGQRLALKTILPKHRSDAEFERRFRNEIRVLRELQHRGIPRIFNDGKTREGEFYFTMSFVEGRSLQSLLREEAALDPLRVATIVRQLVAILEYAHSRGVVHRDLKPDNVLLVQDGGEERVIVLDFGIAKILNRDGELQKAVTMNTTGPLGTPYYMSPEQVSGEAVDQRSDFYSLGVMIYRMVSGDFPFKGSTWVEVAAAHLHEAPRPLPAGSIPGALKELIDRLLEKDRTERPDARTIRELLQQLDEVRTESRRWSLLVVVVLLGGFALLAVSLDPGDDGAAPPAGTTAGTMAEPASAAPDAVGPMNAPNPMDPVELRVREPKEGAHLGDAWVPVRGALPARLVPITIEGEPVELDASGGFEHWVRLAPGRNRLTMRVADTGEVLFEREVVVDTRAPELLLTELPGRERDSRFDRWVRTSPVELRGRATDESPGELRSVESSVGRLRRHPDGTFDLSLTLDEGPDQRVELRAEDRAGNVTVVDLRLALDGALPVLELLEPESARVRTRASTIDVVVQVAEPHIASVEIDGVAVTASVDGTYARRDVPLQRGENALVVTAVDGAGGRSELELTVFVEAAWVLTDLSVAGRAPSAEAIDLPPTATSLELRGTASTQDLLEAMLDHTWLNGARLSRGAVQVLGQGQRFSLRVDELPFGASTWTIRVDDGTSQSNEVSLAVVRAEPRVPAGFRPAPRATVSDSGHWSRIEPDPATSRERGVPVDQQRLALVRAEPPLYAGVHEVTWQRYLAFVEAVPRPAPALPTWIPADDLATSAHPVVYVSHEDARAFCTWAGYRLPTEREWLRAAGAERGPYPWGPDWFAGRANLDEPGDGFEDTAPVGSFDGDRTAAGLFDVVGNVAEWCAGPAVCGGAYSLRPDVARLGALPGRVPGGGKGWIGFRVVLDTER